MFHWICPECGREIAPTVRECSVCDPVAATVENALAGEVEAPARASKEESGPAMSMELPVLESAAVEVAPVPAILPKSDTFSVPAARFDARSPRLAQGFDSALPQFGIWAAGVDPLDHLSAMLDSLEPEPPLSRDPLPLPPPVLPTAPLSLHACIAELQPIEARASFPLALLETAQMVSESPSLTLGTRLPLEFVGQATSRPLGAKLLSLQGPPLEPVRPKTSPLELAPPMAPLGKYSPLAGRPLRPAVPETQILKKDCAPRVTLPGPMLTHRLVKFADRELNPIAPAMLGVRKRLIPGWMVSALIIGTLLGAGFTSVMSLVRSADGKQPSVTEAAAPVVPSVPASPVAQPLEVTGFRIQMDPGKKSAIEYLVVNHSASRVTGVTVNVMLYATDAKAGQPPLCKFQFAAPDLGPFQSKDMTSAIDPVTRPVALPDWQNLRAAVDIAQ